MSFLRCCTTAVAMFMPASFSLTAQTWPVISPNGLVKVRVELGPGRGGTGEGMHLTYSVEHGPEGARATVLDRSPLGLILEGRDLASRLELKSVGPVTVVDERYTLAHGKRRECHNLASELNLVLHNPAGEELTLQLRAYDDGVALRYTVPGSGKASLKKEATGFALPKNARLWCAPSDKATTYSPAYETYYEAEMEVGRRSPTGCGWSYPLLFRTADSKHWGLITEAGTAPSFCGTRLNCEGSNVYEVSLPQAAEGNGQGNVQPTSDLPWHMPWRVVILGDSPGAMVESTLVTDVSPPTRMTDTDWIRPGRVAWSWWSDNPSPQDGGKQIKFVDFAAEMGWEYVLVDANWTIMDNGTIHDVLRHAKSKGVGVLLWYNSGGPHNVVTEKPRDCFTYDPVRKFELKLLQSWGVKGVKVDFFQSDKQDVIGLYHTIMRDAAEAHIMVNFHGCTLPRGWERTYPNLMSMEAVRGEECYIFDEAYPERAPVQNTILPFTRNAVGPMDYTPVGFSNNRYPHKTTYAHELALAVLFETGWLHFTDKPEAYRALPPAPLEFVKQVPVAWDDTRFVAGYPGQYNILARRKGSTWYLAGANGENRAREEEVRLGEWAGPGKFQAKIISDGADERSFDSQTKVVSRTEGFQVKMLPRGGFVAVLKPQ